MDGINSDEDFEEKENIFYNGIHCSFVLNQLIPIPTNLSTPKKNKKGGGVLFRDLGHLLFSYL